MLSVLSKDLFEFLFNGSSLSIHRSIVLGLKGCTGVILGFLPWLEQVEVGENLETF